MSHFVLAFSPTTSFSSMLPILSNRNGRSTTIRRGVLPLANTAMFSTFNGNPRVFAPRGLQVRHLNLHEHQSLDVFEKYGVCVPHGYDAKTPEEAEQFAKALGGGDVVVKAQVRHWTSHYSLHIG